MAVAHSANKLTWLQHFLQELGFLVPAPNPMSCDNQASIHIVSNPMFHVRTKQIEVDSHFKKENERELCPSRKIPLVRCP